MDQLVLNKTISETILEEADKCVLCGLCLPACPTFNETRREVQSPRGRISLAKALAEKKLAVDEVLVASLDSCLRCRACEKACPSKVGYRKMILATLLLIENSTKLKAKLQLPVKTMVLLARTPRLYTLLMTIYRQSGIRWALQKSKALKLLGLDHLDDLLPEYKTPAKNSGAAANNKLKAATQIGLFTGCISQAMDAQTLASAHQVFQALDIELVQADRPLCCGGLNKSDSNKKIEHAFSSAFPPDIHTIVSCISGCTAELSEKISKDKPIVDISDFLSRQDFQNIKFRSYTGIVAVHEPCSLRYPLAAQESVYKLLKVIPGATIIPLPENNRCCGGAGDYLFRQPVMARKLRENKLRAMQELQPAPDVIVTSNLGCSLTLQAGLRNQKNKIEVIHPVTLLARQLNI
jgi:glycolate oxidase iron-sulfur subunit